MMIENYADGGRLIERWDADGYARFDQNGVAVQTRRLTDQEAALVAAISAESERIALPAAHREALASARAILLDYRFGAPGTPSFPEVLSPVQTAVLDYRDSGIRDAECDEHIMWINARVNEINAAALYGAGVLK
jgi:hypothetical protein